MNTDNSKQPEALRLADELGDMRQFDFHIVCEDAASELRNLQWVNSQLLKALKDIVDCITETRGNNADAAVQAAIALLPTLGIADIANAKG